MAKKEKQVNVSLSGDDLQIFEEIKKRQFIQKEPEVFRVCMRFYYQHYDTIDILRRAGIDPDKSLEDLKAEIESIKLKLAEFERKYSVD